MNLPPAFLDELRARVSLSALVGRKVTWDMRKTNQAKGDWWAPCPFHQEKSASFHVDDRKGFYYCFGCQAKGDALTFLRESENLSFMEAVEVLAREAGMTLPDRDPRATEKADHRATLTEVMEKAARFYQMQLRSAQASDARTYLQGRGLDADACAELGIGFAPASRTALWAHLTGAGVAPALIVEAGLAIVPDDGGTPFDRFRGRIMFPIRDARGRCIAFGGRAMDPKAPAKYLNSPETPLFDKGRTLYNIGPARSAMGRDTRLIVAEGYMDVIALVRAGFPTAVAPLGTAITEDQLQMIWRLSPEPVIALDGDKAGLRAGYRLIDLALPHLGPDRALRFCLLPGGMDPDDLLRTLGAGAMRKLLDDAQPLVTLLWQRETEGQVFDSPERRAALDKRLRAALGRISEPGLRAHYADELRNLRAAMFRPAPVARPPRGQGGARRDGRGAPLPIAPQPSTRGTRLAVGDDLTIAESMREEILLATLLRHPSLLPEFEDDLVRADLVSALATELRGAILSGDVPAQAADALLALGHVAIAPPVTSSDPDFARACLTEDFARLLARRGSDMELRDALADLDHGGDEGLTWRLAQAAEARARTDAPGQRDTADLGEDRAALSAQLESLIESQVWIKRKK